MNTKKLTEEEMKNINGGKPVSSEDPRYGDYLQNQQDVATQSSDPTETPDPTAPTDPMSGMNGMGQSF